MGYFTGGGFGATNIYIYDDNDVTGGHVAGPHSFTELAALFPAALIQMQAPTGETTNTGTVFIGLLNIIIGGLTGTHGTAATTMVDTDKYIFMRNSGGVARTISWRATGALPHVTTTFGTKIGSGSNAVGKSGVQIFQNGNLQFRQNIRFYGCYMKTIGTMQWIGDGNNVNDVCGNVFHASSYVLGSSTQAAGMDFYNNIFGSTTLGSIVTSFAMNGSSNNVGAATAPAQLTQSNSTIRNLYGFRTVCDSMSASADIMHNAGGLFVYADVGWSGKNTRHVNFVTAAPIGILGDTEYRRIYTKICDKNGQPLEGVGIRLYSNVASDPSPIFDLATDKDGNVSFSLASLTAPFPNGVLVRDHYHDGVTNVKRDRVFSLRVNLSGGAVAENPLYSGRTVIFEWPGLNQNQGVGSATEDGDFRDAYIAVSLEDALDTEWTECTST